MVSCINLSIVLFYADISSFLVHYGVVVLLVVILIDFFCTFYIHITVSFFFRKQIIYSFTTELFKLELHGPLAQWLVKQGCKSANPG